MKRLRAIVYRLFVLAVIVGSTLYIDRQYLLPGTQTQTLDPIVEEIESYERPKQPTRTKPSKVILSAKGGTLFLKPADFLWAEKQNQSRRTLIP